VEGIPEVLPPVAQVSEPESFEGRDHHRTPRRKRPAGAVVEEECDLPSDAEERHSLDDLA
jgi:hypothetical protein